MISGSPQQLHQASLFALKFGFFQKRRDSHDRIERCSNLMAHCRQEFTLGATGLIGGIPILFQTRFVVARPGEVLKRSHHGVRFAFARMQ